MVNDTYTLLLTIGEVVNKPYDISDLLTIFPKIIKLGYATKDNCRFDDIFKYVKKHCVDNGGCSVL